MKQFETFCKCCGRKIIMTYSSTRKRWVPCNPDIRRYREEAGPYIFVNPYGDIRHGVPTDSRDPGGEWGYQRHRMECATAGRKAV